MGYIQVSVNRTCNYYQRVDSDHLQHGAKEAFVVDCLLEPCSCIYWNCTNFQVLTTFNKLTVASQILYYGKLSNIF